MGTKREYKQIKWYTKRSSSNNYINIKMFMESTKNEVDFADFVSTMHESKFVIFFFLLAWCFCLSSAVFMCDCECTQRCCCFWLYSSHSRCMCTENGMASLYVVAFFSFSVLFTTHSHIREVFFFISLKIMIATTADLSIIQIYYPFQIYTTHTHIHMHIHIRMRCSRIVSLYICMYNTINVYEEFTADELTEEAAASSLAVCLFFLSFALSVPVACLTLTNTFVRLCPLSLFINSFCPSYVLNKAKRKIHNTKQSKESSGAIHNSIVSRASSAVAVVNV